MQKITPFLWFDKEAGEAAKFYADAFEDAKIKSVQTMTDTPSGTVEIVSIELHGYAMTLMSAGPYFKINPSISFMLNFDPSRDADARGKLDALWAKLSEGGKALMPLQEYPFSKHYGWIQDKYGVSWQLILTNPGGEPRPNIIPSAMFVGRNAGKAEEATAFYRSIFKDTKVGTVVRYPAGMEPDKEGTIMFMDYMLENQWFAAMDSAHKHEFEFNEGVSFVVNCEDQAEVDVFWEKLSAVPASEQCGWLKDKYGLSWQIVPKDAMSYTLGSDRAGAARATQAMLKMKKLDVAALKKAYEG